MARLLILPEAEQDIEDLFVYHLDHSDRTATLFADAVWAALGRLEDYPYSGTPRPDLVEGVRVAHVHAYRASVFYVVVGGRDPETAPEETPPGGDDPKGDDDQEGEPVVTVLHVFRQERDVRATDFG